MFVPVLRFRAWDGERTGAIHPCPILVVFSLSLLDGGVLVSLVSGSMDLGGIGSIPPRFRWTRDLRVAGFLPFFIGPKRKGRGWGRTGSSFPSHPGSEPRPPSVLPGPPEHPKEGRGDGWIRGRMEAPPPSLSLVPSSPWGTTRVVPSVHGGMKGKDRRGPSQGLIRPLATSLPRASNPTAKLRAPHSGLKPSPFAKREAAVHLGRPGALPWSRGV